MRSRNPELAPRRPRREAPRAVLVAPERSPTAIEGVAGRDPHPSRREEVHWAEGSAIQPTWASLAHGFGRPARTPGGLVSATPRSNLGRPAATRRNRWPRLRSWSAPASDRMCVPSPRRRHADGCARIRSGPGGSVARPEPASGRLPDRRLVAGGCRRSPFRATCSIHLLAISSLMAPGGPVD